jgi:hypothetical protein
MPQLVNSIERERQKHIFHHIKTRQPVVGGNRENNQPEQLSQATALQYIG